MQFSYILHKGDKDNEEIVKILSLFEEFLCVGTSDSSDEIVNLVLEKRPHILFLSIVNTGDLDIILELSSYTDLIPYIITFSNRIEFAFHAIKKGVNDFILLPPNESEFRKSFLKFKKREQKSKEERIVIKSNSDYNFLKISEILYLKADNNTTDFYLKNGKVITSYKTLKYFVDELPVSFLRIHNSYIVNINYVNRVNIAKSKCYLEGKMLPFSRTYKNNVDVLISRISK